MIPLTIDKLIEFGFVMHEGNEYQQYYLKDDFEVTFRNGKFTFHVILRRTNQDYIIELNYVHELQNLYFAFKKKEL